MLFQIIVIVIMYLTNWLYQLYTWDISNFKFERQSVLRCLVSLGVQLLLQPDDGLMQVKLEHVAAVFVKK